MGWVSAILAIASIAYQSYQAKKAKRRAEREADKRRGFEIVTEGQVNPLPICYGRNRIGGTRVWHAVNRRFYSTTSNADKTLKVGRIAGGSYGTENVEILFFQQVICQAPIHAVHEVLVNNLYMDHWKYSSGDAGLRFEIHYNGNEHDAITTVNYPERKKAVFTDAAYASCFVDLNKEKPQFGGVPEINFLIEGRLIRKVISGILQTTYEYSNNPAWCLLDYLLTVKELNVNDIDLASFESAATLCDTVVLPNAEVSGKIWQPTYRAVAPRPRTNRDIPLYECNIILDSKDSIRDNVEKILDTMGDARLVWSQGKYKLSLEYPGVNNDPINSIDLIDDSKLLLGKEVKIDWPNTTNRFNFMTARFANEVNDFKEDTVSWPQKTAGAYYDGSAFYYDYVSGWDASIPLVPGDPGYDALITKYKPVPEEETWNATTKITGLFLIGNYAVWDDDNTNINLTWDIIAEETGQYKFQYTASAASATFNFNGTDYVANTDVNTSQAVLIGLTAGIKYTITISASKGTTLAGVAAVLTAPSNIREWSTRSTAGALSEITVTDTVYQLFLAEDNNVPLESDIYLEGVVDAYHAKAKIEEMVRTSRTASTVTFTAILKSKYYEPGDILEIASETLRLGDWDPPNTSKFYLRIDNLKLLEEGAIEITGGRIDWTQLAWNVADDEYAKPKSIFYGKLPKPTVLIFTPSFGDVVDTAGTLTWPAVADPRVIGYILYMHIDGDVNINGEAIYKEIGRTTRLQWELDNLENYEVYFGVRAYTLTDEVSDMTITSLKDLSRSPPSAVTDLVATAAGDRNESVRLDWTLPSLRLDGTNYTNHWSTWIFRSKIDNFSVAIKVGETQELNYYIDTPSEYGDLYYWVVSVSHAGTVSQKSNVQMINVTSPAIWDQLTGSTFTPPAPTGLDVVLSFNAIILNWENPTYSEEGGQYITQVYGKVWPIGEAQPTFAEADLIARVIQSTFYRHTSVLGERWVFWVKEESRGGGVSDGYSGPRSATATLITETEISDGAISTPKLQANSVTAANIVAGEIQGYHIDSHTITADNIDARNLVIEDGAGNVIFGAGTAIDWDTYIDGEGKPDSYATRNKVYIQSFTPTGATTGDFWLDTSYDPYVVKWYNGGIWTVASSLGAVFVSPEPYVDTGYWPAEYMNQEGTYDHPGSVIGKINEFNASTYIDNAAIGSAQIANLLLSKNYVPKTSGWIINKDGQMEINEIYARGTIEGSVLIGCTIVSSNQARPTEADHPYYTIYSSQVYPLGRDTISPLNIYSGKYSTKTIPLYAYNSGLTGPDNLNHVYSPKMEIRISFSVKEPTGWISYGGPFKVEVKRSSDNKTLWIPLNWPYFVKDEDVPIISQNGIRVSKLFNERCFDEGDEGGPNIQCYPYVAGYKFSGTIFVDFTDQLAPDDYLYLVYTMYGLGSSGYNTNTITHSSAAFNHRITT